MAIGFVAFLVASLRRTESTPLVAPPTSVPRFPLIQGSSRFPPTYGKYASSRSSSVPRLSSKGLAVTGGRVVTNKKHIFLFIFIMVIIGKVFLFQNCGKFEALDTGSLFMSSSQPQQINCLEKFPSYSCVVDKNSVYEKGKISETNNPDYTGLSLKPVKLTLLDDSGLLKNDTFQVLSYTGKQVRANGPLKFSYELDNGVFLSQVTSYYYSSLAMGFSKSTELSLAGKGLYIITQAPVTGWSSEDNTIYLGLENEEDTHRSDHQHDSGLDGGILLNLVSEANIYYTSKGAINKGLETKHRDCQNKKQMCCVDEKGCSKAMSMGLSMYFASYFFSLAPTVGESYNNSLTGVEDCGISRDLNASKDVLISEAFNACGENNEGYVYPMATVYASIWWNVRHRLLREFPEEAENFQKFYLEHLKDLNGTLNFIDAYRLIGDLDSRDSGFQFTPYFREEFIRRGFSL